MKTFVPFRNYLSLGIIFLFLSLAVKGQTYTTITNGAWSSASTWQGGSIPNASNISSGVVINIKHNVTYSGASIINNGIINIYNTAGLSPRLIVASGISLTNNIGGKIYITNAEYRQYRFVGGFETGVAQTGSIINAGGYIAITNSYVEVAENFINQNAGVRVVNNASITAGKDFKLSSNSMDTLQYSSVSVGMHGTGDFSTTGGTIYFQALRVEVASPTGLFKINGSIANGNIGYITLKNHVTNITGTGAITFSNSIVTSGITLNSYCALSSSNYITNGKVTGAQTPDCTLTYFPAAPLGTGITRMLNFSLAPVLLSGTDRLAGAQYRYEGIAPGIDAILKIDSLVGGATISVLDDNSGSGFIEGFQPKIKSGSGIGQSYAVFTFTYKIAGSTIDFTMDTINLTALDIDGSSTLKEFDQISLDTGAFANYIIANPVISLTQPSPGSFNGINVDGVDKTGIDTTAKENMFTVKNVNVSSFVLRMGMVTTSSQQTTRLYSIYMKDFVYPTISTLPIKLASFNATLNNKTVNVKWTTVMEENVSHFTIERSFDGINFTDIATVFAYGNSIETRNYAYPDDISSVQTNTIFYRLRSNDIDGKTQYSDVRIIKLSNKNVNTVSIATYPNPATNQVNVTIPNNWQNKKVVFEVFGANGQVQKRTENHSSSQTESINISNLAPGFYIVQATCNGETAQQKVIKQ